MVLESYHREREEGNEEREKRGGLCWHELFGSGLFAEGEKMVSNLQETKDNVMYPLLKSSDTWDVGKTHLLLVMLLRGKQSSEESDVPVKTGRWRDVWRESTGQGILLMTE